MPPGHAPVLPGWNPELAVPPWVLVSGLVTASLLLFMGHLAVRGLPREARVCSARWRWRDWGGLLSVVAVALGLRLLRLEQRFDGDEPQLLGIRTLAEWAAHYDARLHPPLVPLVFGWVSAGELDLIRARQVSVFAGGLTSALVYLLGQRRSGSAGGLVAGALVAVAPAALHSSQLARGYALLALGVVASHLTLSLARRSGRSGHWLLYTLVVSLTLTTEYLAIIPVVLDALVVFALARGQRTRISLSYALAGAGALVSFLVVTAWPSLSHGVPVGGDLPVPGAGIVAAQSLEALGGAYPRAALSGFLLVAGLLWWRGARTQIARPLVAAFGVVILALFSAEFTFSRPRYLLHALPLLALVVAGLPRVLGAGLGLGVAGLFIVNQAARLPCYFEPSCHIDEVSVQMGSTSAERRLASLPVARIATDARVRLGRYLWAVDRSLAQSYQALPCTQQLCWRFGGRTYYEFGARRELDLDVVHRDNPNDDPVFLLTGKGQAAPWGCTPEVLDLGVDLYRCSP